MTTVSARDDESAGSSESENGATTTLSVHVQFKLAEKWLAKRG